MTLFFVGGLALLLTPVVMVACQDAALRQQMCEGAHNAVACLTQKAHLIFKNASDKSVTNSAGHIANFSPDVPSSGQKTEPETAGNKSASDMASNVSMVDQAVSLLSAQIAKDPNNPSLHNRLGLIYASVGELQRAESQFNQAIDMSRQQLAHLNGELTAKKEAGQIAEASQIMLNANQMELELSSAHSNLARVFEKLGQQSKVVAQLDQLNKDVVIGEGPLKSLAAKPVAVVAEAVTPKVDGAAAKKVSGDLVAALAKAQALIQAGRMNEAATQLKAVLAIDPSLAEAHEQLGTMALAAGNSVEAREELIKARDLTPKKASIHAALGIAYQYQGKLKEAINEFKGALALNPKDSSSDFNLGNAYAASGKNNEAINSYQKAVAITPNMAAAHNNLGSLYSIKGSHESAIKEFESALALAPQMYSAHYGLGLALYRIQDYAAASREFKIALSLNPSLVDAHQKIAMCDRQSGPIAKHLYQDVAMR